MKKLFLLITVLFVSIIAHAQMGYWCDSTWIELMPITEKCYIEKNGVDSSRVKEFVTRKETVNMDMSYCANLRITPSGDSVFVLPEITLKLKSCCALNSILKQIPQNMSIKSETPTGIYTFVYPVKTDVEVLEAIGKLSRFEEVEWCEPNMLIQIHYHNTLYSQQYYLKNTGQNGGTAGIDINAEAAWQLVTGSSNITVAVIDSGVEKNHEDLSGNVLDGYTVTDVNGKGEPITTYSDYGHGTACAGIIGAKNNTIGIRGVASGVKLLPINISPVFDGFYLNKDSIANAIRWAYNRADVLSCSWGLSSQSNNITSAINEAATLGRNGKGCIIVFSSGNNCGNVSYPATLSNVLAVGAIDNQGNIWNYSNTGSSLDLVAPSGDGNNHSDIVTTDMTGSNGFVNGNYNSHFSGTSAACPQVAGVAALMLSINPYLPESRVRSILQNTATDLGTTGKDNTYGYGLVNAGAAVQQAKNEKPPYSIHKTYISENEIICSISAPSYYTFEWTILTGNMTNLVSGYPLSNQCTVTKSTSGMPTGMLMCKIKSGSVVVYTTVTNLNISDDATFHQVACSFYGVGHPAIPTTSITSGGQAKYVHQGCRVYLYNEVLCFHNASYTGMTPDDWYVTNDHIEFELPYGSGGIPFVVNLKDSYGNLKYYYTFFTYSNNGKALSIDPINTSSYNVSLNFDKTENNGNERPFVNADWLLEVYNTQKALKVYSATVLGNKTTIDTSGWEQGSYIIRAVVGEEVYTEKLMIK